jgi:excisionase family DNA binding protein
MERTMQAVKPAYQKLSARVRIPAEEKFLVSRAEAAQLLSISQRALDYLVANRKLPVRRIGGRGLIPVADLRKYACGDHPENIVA